MFGATPTYMNISNGAYLVIDNSATNAITRSAGAILSGNNGNAGENNRVKWNISSTTGAYEVPWGWSTTDYIPLKFTIGTAGSAGGSFIFSTYRLTSCTNSAAGNLPTGVTNYNSTPFQPGDASIRGVDRFWQIDATSYGTKPDLSSLAFAYTTGAGNDEADNTAATLGCANTLTVTNLGAQRWNSTITSWDGIAYPPIGTASSNTVTLAAADVAPADLAFRWWTLVDKQFPLPVQWLDLSAECEHENIIIKWSTATEQNSDYFTVERSLDGTNFSAIATKPAAGNSSTVQNYSAVDTDPYSGTSYYRVKETDFNGEFIYSGTITIKGCSGDDIIIYGEEGEIIVDINASSSGQYNIEMYDSMGQILIHKSVAVTAGNNQAKLPITFASGIYVIKIFNDQQTSAKKIFIKSSVN